MMRATLLAAAALLVAGCVGGAIYERTTMPLDANYRRTPVFDRHPNEARGEIRHLTIPLGDFQADFAWDSNAIGDIARRNRMETVYYADLEFLNILGVWHQYTVHVYGR
ncbi:MAG: hypothetical protein JXP34_28490 [Planctomycetes bacterium]|nr:hypothetical protein [Planctomycetota bacterium]